MKMLAGNVKKISILILVATGMLLGAFVYGLNRPYIFDDSVYLILSEEISLGRNPYSFFENKPPGIYFLLAGFMKLFGHYWYTGRIFSLFLMIVISTLTTYLVFKKHEIASRFWVGIATFMMLWFCEASLVLTDAGVALFGLLGLLCLRTSDINSKTLIFSGGLFALATFCKQSGVIFYFGILFCLVTKFFSKQYGTQSVFYMILAHSIGFAGILTMLIGAVYLLGWQQAVWNQAVIALLSFRSQSSVYDYVFTCARIGWFVLPALSLIGLKIKTGQYNNETFVFQCASVILMLHCFILLKQAAAHYMLPCAPLIAYLLCYATKQFDYHKILATHKRKITIYFGLICMCILFCGYIKREQIHQYFSGQAVNDSKRVAIKVGQYLDSPRDKVLILSGHGHVHPAAVYYYAGVRPPWPFLYFFSSIPPELRNSWIEKLPALINSSDTTVVFFDPNAKLDTSHYPLTEDVQTRVQKTLKQNFELKHSHEDGMWMWVRQGRKGAKHPRNYLGPFAQI